MHTLEQIAKEPPEPTTVAVFTDFVAIRLSTACARDVWISRSLRVSRIYLIWKGAFIHLLSTHFLSTYPPLFMPCKFKTCSFSLFYDLLSYPVILTGHNKSIIKVFSLSSPWPISLNIRSVSAIIRNADVQRKSYWFRWIVKVNRVALLAKQVNKANILCVDIKLRANHDFERPIQLAYIWKNQIRILNCTHYRIVDKQGVQC